MHKVDLVDLIFLALKQSIFTILRPSHENLFSDTDIKIFISKTV